MRSPFRLNIGVILPGRLLNLRRASASHASERWPTRGQNLREAIPERVKLEAGPSIFAKGISGNRRTDVMCPDEGALEFGDLETATWREAEAVGGLTYSIRLGVGLQTASPNPVRTAYWTDPLLTSELSIVSTFNPGLGSTYMDRGPAPQGLQNSAQGFNPGNPHNKRFALTRRYLVAPCWKNTRSAGLEVLKGREMRVPDEALTYCRAKVGVPNWDVRQLDHRTPLPPF
jgi:hypothetical protein